MKLGYRFGGLLSAALAMIVAVAATRADEDAGKLSATPTAVAINVGVSPPPLRCQEYRHGRRSVWHRTLWRPLPFLAATSRSRG